MQPVEPRQTTGDHALMLEGLRADSICEIVSEAEWYMSTVVDNDQFE